MRGDVRSRNCSRVTDREAFSRILFILVAVALVSFMGMGCARPTKGEILDRTQEIRVSRELKAELGRPDDVKALAMFEQWTYKASDGNVVFHIAGGKVIFRSAE